VINDGRLTLGDGGKMKLDMDPFPISMVELMDKMVLVRMDQAETTKGRNVVVSDELRNRMIKPHNLEIGMWKENVLRKTAKRVKPTWARLIEKNRIAVLTTPRCYTTENRHEGRNELRSTS
jgi:hypothetical protein